MQRARSSCSVKLLSLVMHNADRLNIEVANWKMHLHRLLIISVPSRRLRLRPILC